MRHVKWFVWGVLWFVMIGLALLNIVYWWPWPLVPVALAVVYICGRGIDGGFRAVCSVVYNDWEEVERNRREHHQRRERQNLGGGMVE
jgi:fatty acid desaturase